MKITEKIKKIDIHAHAIMFREFYPAHRGSTAFVSPEMVLDFYDKLNIEKGILVCRLSGGQPASNGDFSGVAKNSFLIENGKITKPVLETMISGNLAEMLNNVIDISKETAMDGSTVYPWVAFDGVTVSGK